MNSVYAGTFVTLSLPVGAPLAAGDYTVPVELNDETTDTSASIDEAGITITEADESAVTISATASVELQPDTDDPAFANVTVSITNDGAPVPTAEVLLDVMLDGEPLETFALAAAAAIPQGESTVTQRYIPPTGWESGAWSFVVRINVIDPATGAATSVAVIGDIPTFDID
jgi:hypothetical protein